ncbi:hypothetical protein [Natronobacterium texcoconense]|uniref:DUF8119 domain-containing protein n=1 Tax=Natronobacterium texcoconense TaxID=1095778 RepID=A0A1H1B483_NATTX|nr:hypothetical protein [Natronobacterium texcoconense]SDQ46713.1 hypothetical protein SAMN04489842_0916 [Natronobacterium texcoconense]
MSIADRFREHVKEHRQGMLYDLMFAVAWVGLVSLLFDFVFVGAPRWVFYMFMLAGIPAYFGFFFSLELAKQENAG